MPRKIDMTQYAKLYPYDVAFAGMLDEQHGSHFCPYADIGEGLTYQTKHWYLVMPNGDRPTLRVERIEVDDARKLVDTGAKSIWCLGVGWIHTSRLHDAVTTGRLSRVLVEYANARQYAESGALIETDALKALSGVIADIAEDEAYAQEQSETFGFETVPMIKFLSKGEPYPGPLPGHADPRAANPDYRP